MSPATQKLTAFRNKHALKKYAPKPTMRTEQADTDPRLRQKPQTLFARTSSKNIEAAKGANMFADIPKDKTTEENGSEGT